MAGKLLDGELKNQPVSWKFPLDHPQAVTLTKNCLATLDEGEMISDAVINAVIIHEGSLYNGTGTAVFSSTYFLSLVGEQSKLLKHQGRVAFKKRREMVDNSASL